MALVLLCGRGETTFEQIVCGTADNLDVYSFCLTGMLSDNLQSLIDAVAIGDTKGEFVSENTKPTELEYN